MPIMSDEGYITLAIGDARFFWMAANVAKSVRIKDPSRPIVLATSAGTVVADDVSQWFDDVVQLDVATLAGVEVKLKVFRSSPFRRTMYLDSDVLLFKKNASHFWSALAGTPLSYVGVKKSEGYWFGEITEKCRVAGVDHIWSGNSGVVYFEGTEVGQKVGSYMMDMFWKHKDTLSRPFERGGYADEPFIAVAMAANGIEAYPVTDRDGQQWHFATVNATAFDLDFSASRAVFMKAGSKVDPTFLHFAGVKLGGDSEIDRAYDLAVQQINMVLVANGGPSAARAG